MKAVLRLLGTALLTLIALRLLSWWLYPVLPQLAMIFAVLFILYFAVNGRRGL